ncbi:MAG: T9SS type A sorting domain-containing protein [Sphingobacteriales bacterium]|nr:MAG: T9SS type A sorting domain-containing protein [Sphingobacteriales bacterium]
MVTLKIPDFMRASFPRICFLIAFLSFGCLFSGTALAQVSLTATAGTTGPTLYTTLKGAFDAINTGTHQGVITIGLTGSTTETATASLNASGTGAASFTRVLVRPAANSSPTISGNISSAPIIKLNGANNVTIEGSNAAGTTRNLTITNTSITSPQAVVIGSVGTVPVTNDTLRNCTVINGVNTSSAVIVSDAATPATAGYFTNISVQNNAIQKAYIGLYVIATATGTNGNGTFVSGNDLNATGTNALRLVGIYAQGVYGATISNNAIGNFETTSAEFDRAIWLATSTTNTTISGNTISGLNYTGATAGYAPIGINVSPGVSNASINVSGNTITNIATTSSGSAIGLYVYSTTAGVRIQKNKISNIKNTNTGGYGAAGMLLVSSSTTAAIDVINNFVWDIASYGTNLWTPDANGNGIVVDGGAGYNLYFNTVWLNTNQVATTGTRAAALLITSNITAANAVNLRNNLLVNTQTVGNANSRFALAVTAPTTVINTFNYNNYYSASGNLAAQGTNATIWNTIAQIQTNMGKNVNSVSLAPAFASATDLHLPAASNIALDNLGTAIAGITDDIDGDPRQTPPDIGADEFGGCSAFTINAQPANANGCPGSTASFSVSATLATGYQWQVNSGNGFTNITNGGIYSGATTNTLTLSGYTVAQQGYSYRVRISGGACPVIVSDSARLTVNARPNAIISAAGPTTICQGASVTLNANNTAGLSYQWILGTTAIAGATSQGYTATAAGSYRVAITNNQTGCKDTSAATAVTYAPPPVATLTPAAPAAVCEGDSITLSAPGATGLTYRWFRNGDSLVGVRTRQYKAYLSGAYRVEVTSSQGCKASSAVVNIIIYPAPISTITYSSPLTFCNGGAVVLNAYPQAGNTYQWYQDGNPLTGVTGTIYPVRTTGAYTVQVVTSQGCSGTSPIVPVTVNTSPNPTITRTGNTLSTDPNFAFYQWFRNNTAIQGATQYSYTATQDGGYRVEVADFNGCDSSSATTVIVFLGVAANPAINAQVQVYPNPAQDQLTIDGSTLMLKGISIVNSTGVKVYQQEMSPQNKVTISLKSLAAGMYYVRIQVGADVVIRKVEVLK